MIDDTEDDNPFGPDSEGPSLSEQFHFVESLLNITPGILYIYDLVECRVVFINGGIQDLLGFSSREIQAMGGQVLEMLMEAQDLERYRQEILPRYAKARDFERIVHQYRMRNKDGGWHWVESTEVVYLRDQGRPVQILGLGMDISDRRRSEEALRESEYFFKESQRASRTGSYRLNVVTGDWEYSEVLGQIFGIDRTFQSDIGGWIQIVHPDDRAMMMRHYADEVMAARRPFNKEYRIIRHCDGEIRWVHGMGELLLDAKGAPIHMIGTIRDITEHHDAACELERHRTHLEDLVRERTAQLEAANQELDSFCYSVSHDLRAPLRHLDGFTKLLVAEFGTELSDEGKHYVETIATASRKMGNLIDDLLQFSRASRRELGASVVDMEVVFREAKQCLGDLLVAHPQVQWNVAPLPSVQGDHNLLRQVWVNLLQNAIKYSRGRQPIRIEVGSATEGGEKIFWVRDNGVGFDMAEAGKLFGVFQRLHRPDEFEGTGIGLAIVHRILQRHGGRIWAQAAPGEGATFHFALPEAPGS